MRAVLAGVTIASPSGDMIMPGFGEALTDDEVAAVTHYVVSHFGGATGTATSRDVHLTR